MGSAGPLGLDSASPDGLEEVDEDDGEGAALEDPVGGEEGEAESAAYLEAALQGGVDSFQWPEDTGIHPRLGCEGEEDLVGEAVEALGGVEEGTREGFP